MPKDEQSHTRPSRSGTWKSIVEVSPETEDLLYQVMLTSDFSSPDEAFQSVLRFYLDSQRGVELNPKLAASLSNALENSEEGQVVSAQEARKRIHHWILQFSGPRLQ